MPAKSEAQLLFEKAEKKFNSAGAGGWMGGLFGGGGSKFEDAADLYQKAGNSFKIEKAFREAGDAYAKEAECRERDGHISEAASAWWTAAKAYRQQYPDLAIQALQQAVIFYRKDGKVRQAAERMKEIGQIYVSESHDLARGADAFLQAGEMYTEESSTASANQVFKDAAELFAELNEFPRALELFERVATAYASSNLTKFSVKEFWLKSLLCALAFDPQTAENAARKYLNQDRTFEGTREYKFARALIDATKDGDVESFTAAVVDYDRITQLDNWKTSILLKIKNGIQEEPALT